MGQLNLNSSPEYAEDLLNKKLSSKNNLQKHSLSESNK